MTSKTKKTIAFSVAAILIILASFILFFSSRTSQNTLAAERNQGVLGELLIDSVPQYVIIRPGLMFKLDTGSDYSAITERDLHFLDSLGFKATESYYPILGRNGRGDVKLKTKRYTLSLPLYMWDTTTDSLGNIRQNCNYNASNVLANVDFVPASTEFSVLGIDFIEKFIVEFRSNENMLALYFDEPDGYEMSERLERSQSPIYWPFIGHRYYMDASVDSNIGRYFFDTGLQKAFVHRPMKDLPSDLRNSKQDSVTTLRGTFYAVGDRNGWLQIGDREGKETIYYFDNDEEEYSINPLNMRDNIDLLFNFPAQQIGFKY